MTDDINADTTTAKPLDYDIRVPDDGGKTNITIKATAETEYGTKAVIESDYDAKDDIKALDWDETHRTWVGGRQMSGDVTSGAWLVDIDAVEDVRDQLLEAGHKVSLNMAMVPDDTEPRDVDFGEAESAVTERDSDDTELVTDGGTELTEPLTDAMVTDRLNQHDDPDHEDGNTVADVYSAFAELQSYLGQHLSDYDEYHAVSHEDSTLVVYNLGPDKADLSIALDEIGVDDEPLRLVISSLMHDLAERHTESGQWGDSYPLVAVKDKCTREAERRTRRRLGALTQQQGGAARALDYWATKVHGLTFEQWEDESGRSTGAIGNSIRRARNDQ